MQRLFWLRSIACQNNKFSDNIKGFVCHQRIYTIPLHNIIIILYSVVCLPFDKSFVYCSPTYAYWHWAERTKEQTKHTLYCHLMFNCSTMQSHKSNNYCFAISFSSWLLETRMEFLSLKQVILCVRQNGRHFTMYIFRLMFFNNLGFFFYRCCFHFVPFLFCFFFVVIVVVFRLQIVIVAANSLFAFSLIYFGCFVNVLANKMAH